MQNSNKVKNILGLLTIVFSIFLTSCEAKKDYHPFVNKVWEIILVKYDETIDYKAPNTQVGKRFLYIHNYEYRCEAVNMLDGQGKIYLNSSCEKIESSEEKIKADLDKIKISGNSAELTETTKINDKDTKVFMKYLLSNDKNYPSSEQIIEQAKKDGNFLKK